MPPRTCDCDDDHFLAYYERYGDWVVNRRGDETTISTMCNPNSVVTGMTYDEAREVHSDLDDAIAAMLDDKPCR